MGYNLPTMNLGDIVQYVQQPHIHLPFSCVCLHRCVTIYRRYPEDPGIFKMEASAWMLAEQI